MKSLAKLAATLREQNITTDLTSREKEFEMLFKHTSKASSDYDTKTEEMIQLLHQVKDQKVTNLTKNYLLCRFPWLKWKYKQDVWETLTLWLLANDTADIEETLLNVPLQERTYALVLLYRGG